MRVSVIFSTYNSPQWLEKVLWGFYFQQHKNFELIIGDDGSTDDTRLLIDRIRHETGMSITHIWHQDKGFRKCRILNKAILEASSDYVVFTDGDCIPRGDFLAVHVREAEPGRYLSGSYQKLPMNTSRAITREDICTGRCFDLSWLKANGLRRSLKNIKLTATAWRAKWLNALTPTRCNFKGSNASAWLSDILAVNGFDERMSWGGLDREFGVRLINSGVWPKHVRYNAVVLHLDHGRGYKNPELMRENRNLRIHNARNGITVTSHGISQLSVKSGAQA